MEITVEYVPSARQAEFHRSGAGDLVYGGAKGGGKSCALVMEALAYGLERKGSRIYLFRETYENLRGTLIREWLDKVPDSLYSYNGSSYTAKLINGSLIHFRYIRNELDAYKYRGQEMDFIGIDELTEHSFEAVQVLRSCLRSAKGYPVKFKGTCNPGGKGHNWVKERYIDGTVYGTQVYVDDKSGSTVAFIPAKVYDNPVLMKNDPGYVRRLENLPENERKAYLDGDWNIFEGQYFREFRTDIHTCEPFTIPGDWRRYRALDYGLDMLACYWIAVSPRGEIVVYRELYESELLMSEATQRIEDLTDEEIYKTIAPPDMWNRQKDTGKSLADVFAEGGVRLTKADNDRVMGWLNLKEWLKVKTDAEGREYSMLRIFRTCGNLVRCLPMLQYDKRNVCDVSTEPHEITHGPDALRYFIAGRPAPGVVEKKRTNILPPALRTDDDREDGVIAW